MHKRFWLSWLRCPPLIFATSAASTAIGEIKSHVDTAHKISVISGITAAESIQATDSKN